MRRDLIRTSELYIGTAPRGWTKHVQMSWLQHKVPLFVHVFSSLILGGLAAMIKCMFEQTRVVPGPHGAMESPLDAQSPREYSQWFPAEVQLITVVIQRGSTYLKPHRYSKSKTEVAFYVTTKRFGCQSLHGWCSFWNGSRALEQSKHYTVHPQRKVTGSNSKLNASHSTPKTQGLFLDFIATELAAAAE